MIRIGESFLGKSNYKGFHPTGTCGVFGAAAACATLMGLDALHTKYALGLAGSFAAGLIECTGEGSWREASPGRPSCHEWRSCRVPRRAELHRCRHDL